LPNIAITQKRVSLPLKVLALYYLKIAAKIQVTKKILQIANILILNPLTKAY
jgi:hypothetical protein